MRGFIAALALVGVSLRAQSLPRADSAPSVPALDETRLFTNLATLAADSMEGRLAGSPGSARARAFLVREFGRIGLQPLVKGYAISFSAQSHIPSPVQRDPPPRLLRTRQSTIPVRHYPLIFGNKLVGVVRGTLHPDRYDASVRRHGRGTRARQGAAGTQLNRQRAHKQQRAASGQRDERRVRGDLVKSDV